MGPPRHGWLLHMLCMLGGAGGDGAVDTVRRCVQQQRIARGNTMQSAATMDGIPHSLLHDCMHGSGHWGGPGGIGQQHAYMPWSWRRALTCKCSQVANARQLIVIVQDIWRCVCMHMHAHAHASDVCGLSGCGVRRLRNMSQLSYGRVMSRLSSNLGVLLHAAKHING